MTQIKLKITLSVTDDLDADELANLARHVADGSPVLADLDIGVYGDCLWIVATEAHIVAIDDGYGLHMKGQPFTPSPRTIDGEPVQKQIEGTA